MAGVKHHEDLVAWQLSESLRQAVVALLAKPAVARHLEFCDQIRRSSRSAPSNIAEGFSRYKPRDFARYMRIALGSLGETQNHLRAALNDKMISEQDFDTVWSLSVRAIKTSKKLHSYLRRCDNRD
jgi:four helix bundle protein